MDRFRSCPAVVPAGKQMGCDNIGGGQGGRRGAGWTVARGERMSEQDEGLQAKGGKG